MIKNSSHGDIHKLINAITTSPCFNLTESIRLAIEFSIEVSSLCSGFIGNAYDLIAEYIIACGVANRQIDVKEFCKDRKDLIMRTSNNLNLPNSDKKIYVNRSKDQTTNQAIDNMANKNIKQAADTIMYALNRSIDSKCKEILEKRITKLYIIMVKDSVITNYIKPISAVYISNGKLYYKLANGLPHAPNFDSLDINLLGQPLYIFSNQVYYIFDDIEKFEEKLRSLL